MPFHLRAKKIILTYSQIDHASTPIFLVPGHAHYEFLQRLNGPPRVYRLARESHQDGGTHFHCYTEWEKPISTRNQRILDYGGYHPNIEVVRRTPHKAWDYVGKDDDIIYEHGSPQRESGTKSTGRDQLWGDALNQPDKASFLTTLREVAPRDFVLYNETLERFADRHYRPETPQYVSPNFTTHGFDGINEWLDQSRINKGDRRGRVKSLILWGPTLTGKTLWARSLGK